MRSSGVPCNLFVPSWCGVCLPLKKISCTSSGKEQARRSSSVHHSWSSPELSWTDPAYSIPSISALLTETETPSDLSINSLHFPYSRIFVNQPSKHHNSPVPTPEQRISVAITWITFLHPLLTVATISRPLTRRTGWAQVISNNNTSPRNDNL